MKVKITHHDYTPAGTVVEVPQGMGEYLVKTGQGVVVEADSPVAHDMGTVPNAGLTKLPEKVVNQPNAQHIA